MLSAGRSVRATIVEGLTAGRYLGMLMLVLAAGGCASVGPATVPHDRSNYISSVAESWKEQTLMNVVRLRYGDAPSFVDVSSVISSYTFQAQLSAEGSASYVDRPTITYTPVAGVKFARELLRPIPPSAIFELIQAGYPADAILRLTVQSINGVDNRSSLGRDTREADPKFYPLLRAMRSLQLAGVLSIRLQKRGADEDGVLVFSRPKTSATDAAYQFVLRTLGVQPGAYGEVSLTFGSQPHGDKEVAVLSRSMLSVLNELANGIEAPSADVARGRTPPAGRSADAPDPRDRPLARILSGQKAPADAYVAVRYRGTWYWIRDDDMTSKSVFSFLMIFFSLAETGTPSVSPVVTIPAN